MYMMLEQEYRKCFSRESRLDVRQQEVAITSDCGAPRCSIQDRRCALVLDVGAALSGTAAVAETLTSLTPAVESRHCITRAPHE